MANIERRTNEETEQAFLDKLRQHPNDEDNRTVYADWLEEQGRSSESEFLRLQVTLKAMSLSDPNFQASGERLRDLAKALDQTWRTLVAYAPIEHCDAKFDFPCPRKWEALTPTKDEKVRSCDACQKDVYYSQNLTEAYVHASQGRCVVIDLVQIRMPGDLDAMLNPGPPMLAGAVAVPPEWQAPPPPLPPEPPKGFVDRLKNLFTRS